MKSHLMIAGALCLFSLTLKAEGKQSPAVKEIGRVPAANSEIKAVASLHGTDACETVFRIDDNEKQNVCYVMRGCGSGTGVSIFCLKK